MAAQLNAAAGEKLDTTSEAAEERENDEATEAIKPTERPQEARSSFSLP